MQIVKEQSAILGVARERKTSVNANHSDLCKFTGPGDGAYVTARQALRELILEVTPTITSRDARDQPNAPPDLKYAILDEEGKIGDERKYPVLQWRSHTYWGESLEPLKPSSCAANSNHISTKPHGQPVRFRHHCV